MSPGDQPFDVTGPLPRGKVAIQASAGTGKTFALAALAARYIVEADVAASELLIVTFTRAATDELRAKVRDRLTSAADHLAHRPTQATDDELLGHLARHDVPQRLARLQRAITEFDSATVTTIHGFAKQVLGALGVSAGTDPDARLEIDSSDLIEETCADVLVRAAIEGYPTDHLPSLVDLRRATELADGQPDLDLVPTRGQPGASEASQILAELVNRSVRAVADRRLSSGTLSFDDVLVQLRSALCGSGPGAAAAIDTLRNRFKVVLIDEFQDTDTVQWDIFSTLFDRPGATTALVLVGDPKQAIYAFRGADVHAYLAAVGEGSRTDRRSLAVNWRSDDAVLASLGALFGGATFGDPDIPFVTVNAAPANQGRRLRDRTGAVVPALSLRLAVGDGITRSKPQPNLVIVDAAERAVFADLVLRIGQLLVDGRLPTESGGGSGRPVRPPDIAVLVGKHAEAVKVQAALARAGIPAVVARGGSVLRSSAADHLRWLLEGLARPSDARRARMVALSWFGGRSAAEVASLSDTELAAVQERLRQWAELLATHTVAEVLATVWSESGVMEHVLRAADGDRNMTDLDHVAELLSGAGSAARSSVAGLLSALDTEPEPDGDTEVESDVAARRIASEADAVQIMTVWAAKGLQFPVVCLPTLWRAPFKNAPVVYVDPQRRRRTLDLAQGKGWPDEAGAEARSALAFAEATGERLRLLYVALTRAQHHSILWWAPTDRSAQTALARILFARTDGVIDPDIYGAREVPIPADHELSSRLAPLVDAAAGTIDVAVIDVPEGTDDDADTGGEGGAGPWGASSPGQTPSFLAAATLRAVPDRSRRRWSFSAIVDQDADDRFDPSDGSLSDSGAADEQDDGDGDAAGPGQPPASPGWPSGADTEIGHAASPLAGLPAGTAFGTLVHAVLEEVDATAADLEGQLDAAIGRQLAWRTVDLTPVGSSVATPAEGRRLLVEGLRAAISTPFGARLGQVCLGDLGANDRLTEMTFDLRLSDAGPATTVRRIGQVTLDHLAPDDPLHPWAAGLAGGRTDTSLTGHLTGSIDLVLRVPDGAGAHRFVVADYKTNALHARGAPVRPDDYGQERMAEAMTEHHYPLQALLYSVALHRYLRWRLADYRPEDHLGGCAYLFLRGMRGRTGFSGDHPTGVFDWAVPASLVVELSELLDGHSAPAVPS